MPTANDLRRGMAINYNGDITVVLDSQHRTPGNLRAFVQATLRSIRTGKSSDVRFSSSERIEVVPMMIRKMEFSYKDAQDFVFSDPETYKPSRYCRNGDARISSWRTAPYGHLSWKKKR
jgi:elongation factor P